MSKLMLLTTVAGQQYVGRNFQETNEHFNIDEVHLIVPRRVEGGIAVDFIPFGAPLTGLRKPALMVDPDEAPKNIVRAFSQFQTGLVLPE